MFVLPLAHSATRLSLTMFILAKKKEDERSGGVYSSIAYYTAAICRFTDENEFRVQFSSAIFVNNLYTTVKRLYFSLDIFVIFFSLFLLLLSLCLSSLFRCLSPAVLVELSCTISRRTKQTEFKMNLNSWYKWNSMFFFYSIFCTLPWWEDKIYLFGADQIFLLHFFHFEVPQFLD